MKFSTWDIETENWNEFKVASIYNEKQQFILYSIKDLVDHFIKVKGIFYAHYGGGFDNLFVLDEIRQRKNLRIIIKNISGDIPTVSVYYTNSNKKLFELRDSFKILPLGLKKLAEEFTDEQKQDIDRTQIHIYTKEQIDDYVISDSRILYKVITEYLKLTGKEDIKITLASECFKEHKTLFDHEKIRVPAYLDDFLRKSYAGARTEVFKRYGKNLKYFDFKSMYPSVMLEKEYPAGIAIKTNKLEKNKLGVYECEVIAPDLDIPFLHTYSEDNKLIFPTGSFRGVYTSVEIEKALSLGYEIKINHGYYFTDKEKPFESYVRKWYNIKQQAENENNNGLRLIAKLYLNSLYGKFGQRRTFRKIIDATGKPLSYFMKKYKVKDYNEVLDFVIVEEDSKSKYTTVQIASFVTAYGRIKLYEALEEVQEKDGNVYYCDTDSIVTDITLDTGKELGMLDIEDYKGIKMDNIAEGIFLFPKFYALRLNEECFLQKHKGISKDKLFSFENYKRALELEDYSNFKDYKESIASILECNVRSLPLLSVVQKTRSVKGVFDKRLIDEDKITTYPIKL